MRRSVDHDVARPAEAQLADVECERPLRGAFLLALALGGLVVLLGIAYTFVRPLIGGPQWRALDGTPVPSIWYPSDIWTSLKAAHYVQTGALGYIYESGKLSMLPLFPIVLAPLAALGDLFGFEEVTTYHIPWPSMWLFVAPFLLGVSVLTIYSTGALAVEVGLRVNRRAIQAGVAAFVAVPICLYGHFEDLFALAFLMIAVRAIVQGRMGSAALGLGLAIGFKQWAGLALPLLALQGSAGRRLRFTLASITIPVSLAIFVLTVDWEHAGPDLLRGETNTFYGHAALFIGDAKRLLAPGPYRAGTVLSALVVGWCLRNRRDVTSVFAGLALVYLFRLVFEPVIHPYYLAPVLAFAILTQAALRGGLALTSAASAVALLLFMWHPAGRLWWPIFFAVCALIASPVLHHLTRAATDDHLECESGLTSWPGRPPTPSP